MSERQPILRGEIPHELFEAQRENVELQARVEHLTEDVQRLERIATLLCTAYNHPSGEYGQDEADEAADLACSYLESLENRGDSQGEASE